jgi:hypothetical protein
MIMSYFFHVVNLTPEGKQWKSHMEWTENGLIPLGTRAEIHKLIAEIFPESDFSDPLWIPVTYPVGDDKFSMEILLDHQEPVRWLGLRHGSYEACKIIHDETGWDAFDPAQELVKFA